MLWLNDFVTAGIYRDEKSSFNQPVYYRISFLIIYFTNWLIDYLQNVGSYILTGYTNTWHQIWICLYKRSTDLFFLFFSAHKHANEPIPININAILYWPFFYLGATTLGLIQYVWCTYSWTRHITHLFALYRSEHVMLAKMKCSNRINIHRNKCAINACLRS